MHKPDPVETILARLMPPALSEEGQRDIEAMLDELAGPVVAISPAPAVVSWPRRWVIGGIAAAGVAAAMIFPMKPAAHPVASAADQETPAEFQLVNESDRIESTSDEGWLEDADGSAMQALRLNVVEENNILDEETGILMTVSEPREEILLMPVSAF